MGGMGPHPKPPPPRDSSTCGVEAGSERFERFISSVAAVRPCSTAAPVATGAIEHRAAGAVTSAMRCGAALSKRGEALRCVARRGAHPDGAAEVLPAILAQRVGGVPWVTELDKGIGTWVL